MAMEGVNEEGKSVVAVSMGELTSNLGYVC
jgi:hypothetical protein